MPITSGDSDDTAGNSHPAATSTPAGCSCSDGCRRRRRLPRRRCRRWRPGCPTPCQRSSRWRAIEAAATIAEAAVRERRILRIEDPPGVVVTNFLFRTGHTTSLHVCSSKHLIPVCVNSLWPACSSDIQALGRVAESQTGLLGGRRVHLLFASACRCTDPAWENG